MTNRRDFLKKAGLGTVTAAGASTLAAPAVLGQEPIKWRLQTYAGPALAEHVIKPSIDAFNKAANGEMVIELYTSDQLVPTGELFRAMQQGTIDAVQSDDDSMASPTEVTVFGGYFPFASRYSLDVPVLFNQYGLNEIWDAEYSKVGVKHISAGSWDPCHFATKDPIRSLADLKGKRVFTFPDGRPLYGPVRRRAGHPALGRHRSRRADRRARTASHGRASPRTTPSAGRM